MILTYKYKLYKTKRLRKIDEVINIAGIIYNHCIALHKRYYKLWHKTGYMSAAIALKLESPAFMRGSMSKTVVVFFSTTSFVF
jgi:hypothetical protein